MRIQPISQGGLAPGLGATAQATAAQLGDAAFANELGRAQQAAQEAGRSPADAKLQRVCQEMESVFLNMLLSRMRSTVTKTGLLGENKQSQELMQSMLDQELSKTMSQAGGIGLAAMMYKQLQTAAGGKEKTDSQPSR